MDTELAFDLDQLTTTLGTLNQITDANERSKQLELCRQSILAILSYLQKNADDVNDGLPVIGNICENFPIVFGPGDVGFVSVVLCDAVVLLTTDVSIGSISPLLEHVYMKDLRAVRLFFSEIALALSDLVIVFAELSSYGVQDTAAEDPIIEDTEAHVELLREFSKLRSDTYNRSNKLIIDVSSLERCSFAMCSFMRIIKQMCESYSPWLWDAGTSVFPTLCRHVRLCGWVDRFNVFSTLLELLNTLVSTCQIPTYCQDDIISACIHARLVVVSNGGLGIGAATATAASAAAAGTTPKNNDATIATVIGQLLPKLDVHTIGASSSTLLDLVLDSLRTSNDAESKKSWCLTLKRLLEVFPLSAGRISARMIEWLSDAVVQPLAIELLDMAITRDCSFLEPAGEGGAADILPPAAVERSSKRRKVTPAPGAPISDQGAVSSPFPSFAMTSNTLLDTVLGTARDMAFDFTLPDMEEDLGRRIRALEGTFMLGMEFTRRHPHAATRSTTLSALSDLMDSLQALLNALDKRMWTSGCLSNGSPSSVVLWLGAKVAVKCGGELLRAASSSFGTGSHFPAPPSALLDSLSRFLLRPWSAITGVVLPSSPSTTSTRSGQRGGVPQTSSSHQLFSDDSKSAVSHEFRSSTAPCFTTHLCWTLRALNWLPTTVSPDARKNILVASLSDPRVDVQLCAIRSIPLFLQRMGQGHFVDFVPRLAALAHSASEDARRCVAKYIGYNACLFEHFDKLTTAVRYYVMEENSDIDSQPTFLPNCDICSTNQQDVDVNTAHRTNTTTAATILVNHQQPVDGQGIGKVAPLVHSFKLSAQEVLTARAASSSDLTCALWAPFLSFISREKPNNYAIRDSFLRSYSRLLVHSEMSLEELSEHLHHAIDLMRDVGPSGHFGVGSVLCGLLHQSRNSAGGRAGGAPGADTAASAPSSTPTPSARATQFTDMLFEALGVVRNNLAKAGLDQRLTIVVVFGHLGCMVEGNHLVAVVLGLIERLVDTYIHVRAVAYDQIMRICAAKKLTFSELMTKYRDETVWYLIRKLVEAPEMVNEVSVNLLDQDTHQFVEGSLDVILPRIVFDCNADLMREVAKRVNKEVEQLVQDNLCAIVTYLVISVDELKFDSWKFLYDILHAANMKTLVEPIRLPLVKQLVFNLGDETKRDKAHKGLKAIHGILSGPNTTHDVAELLKEHFVEIVDDLTLTLLQRNESNVQSQLQALRALKELITRMKPYLKIHHVKLITILKMSMTGFKSSVLREETATVWLVLLQTFAANNEIKVIGIPLPRPELQVQLIPVFELLFIQHGGALREYFKQIPFMPEKPDAIKNITAQFEAMTSNSRTDLATRLATFTEILKHENPSVRSMALDKLLAVLRSKREQIRRMALLGEEVDPSIKQLVEVVLQGCRDPDRGARVKFGAILGELGAIDPARLRPAVMDSRSANNAQVEVKSTRSDSNLGSSAVLAATLDKSESDLAHDLISTCLIRAFRSANDLRTQDSAAYAIQELMKLQHCGPKVLTYKSPSALQPKEAAAFAFWHSFAPEEQLIVTPLLSSKYRSVGTPPAVSSAKPIYNEKVIHYRAWLCDWTLRLVNFSEGNSIYRTCREFVRRDTTTCNFLIPHIVLGILRNGTVEGKKAVSTEIHAVLEGAASDAGHFGKHREVMQLATQQIFTLIDILTAWADTKRREEKARRRAEANRAAAAGGTPAPSSRPKRSSEEAKDTYVEEFLSSIPQSTLAKAAFRCKAYVRALRHFEQNIRRQPRQGAQQQVAQELGMLQQIYAGIDEPDAMIGLSSLKTQTSLEDAIIESESEGNWSDALMAIDQAMQQQSNSADQLRHLQVSRLRCLLQMGLFEQAMTTVRSALIDPIHNSGQNANLLRSFGVQAAWRLNNWRIAEEFIEQGCVPDFDLHVAKIMIAIRKRNEEAYLVAIQEARNVMTTPLAAASLESYARAYSTITRLHMLAELEQSWTVLNNTPANQPISDAHRQHLLHDWESRFKLTQPSLKTREPVLNLRFSLLTMLGVPSEANRTCLKLARVARSAQRYPTARYALLKIQDFSTRGYTMENARVLWETGQGPRALNDLRRVIGTHQSLASGTLITLSGETSTSLLSAEREAEDSAKKSDQDRSLAKAALQVAMWLDSTGQLSPQEIINYYRVAIQSVKAWSKAYFHFGRYLDKTSQQLLQAALGQQSTFPSSFSSPSPAESKAGNSKKSGADEEKPVKWDLLPDVLGNYSLCLVFGHQYVHQVMPRMLTLWLDAGETFQRIEKPAHVLHTRSSSLNGPSQYEIATDGWKKTDQVIASSLEKLAPYFWFTALPQLLSRIAHPQAEVWKRMKGIILDKLLLLWPHQTVWYTIALAISGNRTSTRFMRYKEIREEVKRRSRLPGKDNAATSHQAAAALSLIDESEKLGSLLLEVAKYTLPNTQNPSYTLSIKKLFAKLGSRYDETAPPERARMIIPSETQLSATVPFIEEWDPDTVRKLRQHTPFSPKGQLVFINGFEDKVEVMRSLIKPKRLTMVGTDGRGYGFLAKPKDDLRKDARLMEFNTVVNKLLRHDPEGRRRQLYIRTYPVILLSEDSGMLGWVKGTRPYRSIVSELYESEGNPYINLFTETKALYTSLNKNDPTWLPKWREMRDRVWYSIFWKFFVNNFPEPSAWYRARLAYTRTCAVMSFVGFVLGLGDRHGENILFDQVTGDTVHVDLNCLFFRGQMLAEPERVPFRLTHNMVDAMGVTGCEGVFRRTSEIVVRTLLANKETLLSVLETLVHDPLIEWSKQQPNAAPGELDFITQETMRGIAERLSCIKRTHETRQEVLLPLSVEGYVSALIEDSTSDVNLCKMYIGWTSFL